MQDHKVVAPDSTKYVPNFEYETDSHSLKESGRAATDKSKSNLLVVILILNTAYLMKFFAYFKAGNLL